MGPKKTPLHKKHIERKAKMTEFAGFMMPVYYRGIMPEHLKVRTSVGLFDLSHMGAYIIKGPRAAEFLQMMTLNDVNKLSPFMAQYTAMCYDNGGLVDDLVLYRRDNDYMMVVNAANIKKDFAWLKEHQFSDGVVLIDTSDSIALLAVQGPKAEKVLKRITRYPLHEMGFYRSAYGEIAGKKVFFSRTGYTGEDGFEIYVDRREAEDLWDAILKAGRNYGIEPIGIGARDTLRLEMRYLLYGNDMDEKTNPIEAGLSWIVKMDKGDFIGKEAIAKAKEEGVSRKLVAFQLKERGFPRPEYPIVKDEQEIGIVTSGTFSPSLNRGIGLGYVRRDEAKVENEVWVIIRERGVPAEIIKPPFYKKGSRK